MTRIELIRWICILALASVGCARAVPPPSTMVSSELPAGSLVVLPPDRSDLQLIRFAEPAELVIRSSSELSNLWDQHSIAVDRNHTLPNIDFSQFMLVYVTMGTCPSGGYEVSFTDLRESASDILVTVIHVNPGRKCSTTQLVTYPTALALLPKSEKSISFRRVVSETVCTSW